MTDAADGTHVDEGEHTTAPPPEHPSTTSAPLALVLVLVLLLAAATGVAVWQAMEARSLAADAAEQRRVATVASRMGEALLSYDHTDLDGSEDAVVALSSPDFAAEYSEAFDGGLAAAIEDLEATAEGTVTATYVQHATGTDARAIVVVDAVVTSTAGTRTLEQAYLEMPLVQVDGEWRVDGITSISALGETLVPTGEE